MKEIFMVFLGCLINGYTLDIMIKKNKDIGTLISICQIFFVTLCSFLLWIRNETRIRAPIKSYVQMGLLFFTVNIANLNSFAFGINHTLHILIKSSSLISTLLIGSYFFSKKYSRKQIVSVIFITIGLFFITVYDLYNPNKITCCDTNHVEINSSLVQSMVGLFVMILALVASSWLGFKQEESYSFYKTDWLEGMFMTHLFCSLFSFTVIKNNLFEALEYSIAFWLFLNCLSHFVCITGVYVLNSKVGNLSCNVVLTLRKFTMILILSRLGSNVTFYHWISSLLVFGGAFVFSTSFK